MQYLVGGAKLIPFSPLKFIYLNLSHLALADLRGFILSIKITRENPISSRLNSIFP